MTKEVRKVCEIGNSDISASSTCDAYPSIEVKDELRRITDHYHSLINDEQKLTSRPLSRLKRAAEVGAFSNWDKIAIALAGSLT